MSSRASRTLYVGNLPGDIHEREVEDLFYKYGRIVDIDLKIPPRPPGYAFVEFEDYRDAEDAIRGRDGYDFDGHPLRVELAHSARGSSSVDRYSSYSGSSGHGGVSRRSDYRVLVTGLPSSASWQDLKDHMRRAGDVCFSQVFRDRDGMRGIVDYTNYDDMKYAIRKLDDSLFRNQFSRAYIRVKKYDSRRSYSRSPSRSPYYSRNRSPSRSPYYSRNRSPSHSYSYSSKSRSKSPRAKYSYGSPYKSRSRSVSSRPCSEASPRSVSRYAFTSFVRFKGVHVTDMGMLVITWRRAISQWIDHCLLICTVSYPAFGGDLELHVRTWRGIWFSNSCNSTGTSGKPLMISLKIQLSATITSSLQTKPQAKTQQEPEQEQEQFSFPFCIGTSHHLSHLNYEFLSG
ncbi:hypothetical protein U1Q18_035781 [Sarracenia purpurea var. burkii]